MEVIPAIDLHHGNVVRLYQGDYARETVFGDDPVLVVHRWAGQGATRVHVVDLDGAMEGRTVQRRTIGQIARAVLVPIQVGGGIRRLEDIEILLDMGVNRVVLGTVAVENPTLVAEACRHFADSVIVAIDARDTHVAVHGWVDASTVDAIELGKRMAGVGVRRFIYTDIGRDGTLQGPNIRTLQAFMAATGRPVIASGGVANIEDVMGLATAGAEGAIVGTALYTGAIKLRDANAVIRQVRRAALPMPQLRMQVG